MLKKKSTKDLVKPDSGASPSSETPVTPKKEKKEHKVREKKERRPIGDILRNRAFLGGVMIAAALLLGLVIIPAVQQQVTTTTTQVVVFTQDLQEGSLITEDTVTTEEMVDYNLPDGAMNSVEEVIGQYLTIDACKGDILTTARLSSEYPGADPSLASIPDGKYAISLSLDTQAQSLSGKIRAGDVVQIFAILNSSDSTDYVATAIPELHYVEVLSVTDEDGKEVTDAVSSGDDDDELQQIATLTLLCNEEQAAAVAGLEVSATLHAALVSRGDEDKKTALLKEQANYFYTATDETVTADTESEVG